jgi:hypothetical protein
MAAGTAVGTVGTGGLNTVVGMGCTGMAVGNTWGAVVGGRVTVGTIVDTSSVKDVICTGISGDGVAVALLTTRSALLWLSGAANSSAALGVIEGSRAVVGSTLFAVLPV